jgi:hypothetical protein
MAGLFDPNRPLFDVAGILRQTFQGVYSADGRQLGSYQSLQRLCAGDWITLKGEARPPPSALYLKEITGRLTPLAEACTGMGFGVPAWATPAQKAAAKVAIAKQNAPLIPKLVMPPLDLPNLFEFGGGDGGGDDGDDDKKKSGIGAAVILGGAALVAAALLLRRD